MDFLQLEYVIVIEQDKTLLSTAERLFLSPQCPDSKLEDELQTPLFKRTTQGWILTTAGQIYIDMAKNALQGKKFLPADRRYQRQQNRLLYHRRNTRQRDANAVYLRTVPSASLELVAAY